MNKKIAIVGTVGLPQNYGGFENLVDNLTKTLNSQYDFTVYCSSKSYKSKLKYFNKSKLKYINISPNGISSVFYDIVSMIHACRYADAILILGVSGCIFLPFLRIISGCKIIVNIDGIEWKRQKWNLFAKSFLKFSEKIAVKYAHNIIADNLSIVEYIKLEYNKKSDLIAYGGDHVKKINLSHIIQNQFNIKPNSYAFKVCRIVPENNIELILKSFSNLPQIKLLLVGNWSNSSYSKQLRDRYAKFKNLILIDSIYNYEILNSLRSNCFLYVHGHSAGGTNPSLVEAMNLGLPIFCFDVNFNRQTTRNSAKFFNSYEQLMDLINNTHPKELIKCGKKMKKIAIKEYNWTNISKLYAKLIDNLFILFLVICVC